ncbi:MAG TPA: ATP-binding protein [Acidimicrobiales bacterium]|nr:ATP-binding protein [Acidimicrobiales bacterium]
MRTANGEVLGRLDAVVAGTRPRRGTRAAVLFGGMVSILGIALVDHATGARLSLSVFYLVPVVAVTIGVSSGMGFFLAAAASLAWTFADASIGSADRSFWLQTWNGILRFSTVSLVVALLSALRRTVGQARASERRSKEFLGYAAHQLRTPVAGVRASAEALVLTASRAEREQLASNLIREATRMGRLVTSLLRLTRLDQGDPLESRACDVEAVVGRELERIRVLAPDLELRLRVSPGLEGPLLLDPVALGEIIANLLDNARRHAAGHIDVVVEAAAQQLRIAIGDDGPGLPVGGEGRAFDRFVSLDGHGGAGLGLAIARSLAEAQEGALTYASRQFVVTLPAITPTGALESPGTRRTASFT